MEREEYVNIDDALKRVRGNTTMYCRLLKLFLASEDFDKIENALANGDLKTASESAHAIKGIAGNLSLIKLQDESAALMTKLRENELDPVLLESYRDALTKTKEYVSRVITELS